MCLEGLRNKQQRSGKSPLVQRWGTPTVHFGRELATHRLCWKPSWQWLEGYAGQLGSIRLGGQAVLERYCRNQGVIDIPQALRHADLPRILFQ